MNVETAIYRGHHLVAKMSSEQTWKACVIETGSITPGCLAATEALREARATIDEHLANQGLFIDA